MKGNNLNKDSSDVEREEANKKSMPMKHMDLHHGKSGSEGSDRRLRNIPVKQTEGNMTDKETLTSVEKQSMSTDGNVIDKDTQTTEKRKSTFPRKTSKLPPVCLQLDPLPKKNNGNGSSRSPSPPAPKEHSQATADGTSKAFSPSSTRDRGQADMKLQNSPNVSGGVKPVEKSTKVTEKSSEKKDEGQRDGSQSHDTDKADLRLQNASNVSEGIKPKEKIVKVLEKSREKKDEDQRDESQGHSQITSNMTIGDHESSYASIGTKESMTDGEEHKDKENEAERKVDSVVEEGAKGARDSTERSYDECRKERKVLSDVEAAVLIQAAYRGFQVRKWEPLKKMREIAEVSKHVSDVKGSIQDLEASSDTLNVERQRVAIGETIMRLLLKLDIIQV